MTSTGTIVPLRLLAEGPGGKSIDCALHGGSAEQLRCLLQVPGLADGTVCALAEAMAGIDSWQDRLVWAVAHPSVAQRVLSSQELLRDLWRSDRGLGPYPLLDLLADYETEHVYYPAYRDHLVHMLRVWLLGLYLLHRLPLLHSALRNEVAAEPAWAGVSQRCLDAEVLRRWRVAACWHDLGYVFEVQHAKAPNALIKRTFTALNATFSTPMAELGVLTRDQEIKWRNEASDEHPLPSLPPLEAFDSLTSGRNRVLWQDLAPAGWRAGLAGEHEPSGGLQPYLELCRAGEISDGCRPAFLDHGIASALLLLRLHRFITAYTNRLAKLLAEEEAADHAAVAGVAEQTATAAANGTVLAAARAIALHNIVPHLPAGGAAAARDLTPHNFHLHLQDADGRSGTALAYLLALADGLQEWDRPRFTAPRAPDDIGLIDQEVRLTAGDGKIWLRYEMAEPEAGHRFQAVHQDLGSRLAGINELLVRGCCEPAALLEREARPVVLAGPQQWDLQPYLDAVLGECGTIELRGIVRRGRSRGAISVPIQEIFAPLEVEGGRGENLWQLLVDPGREELGLRLGGETPGGERPPVLLLVGAPGSGKSTFLRMTVAVLAHALAGARWAREHAAAKAFLDAGMDLPVPVLIRLSELATFVEATERQQKAVVNAPDLLASFLTAWTESRKVGIPASVLESWLQHGQAVLLLDGLDEIPGRGQREQMTKIISNAMAGPVYGACRCCLTSRPLRDEIDHPTLRPRTITGLGDEAIQRFLEQWASYVSTGGEELDAAGDGESYAADLLDQARRASPAIRDLLRNPLMLTCLAVIHWNERRLPEQRAELLDAILTWLLRARPATDGFDEHLRRRLFQELARAMHCHGSGRIREIALPEAARAVSHLLAGENEAQRLVKARQILEAEVVTSGIISPRGEDHLHFWHLSFQELLVASQLVDSTEDSWPELLTNERLANPEWREVVLLAAGLLGSSQRCQALLRLVLAPAKEGSLTAKARAYGLVMAMLNDLRPYRFVPDAELGLSNLGQEVLRIFTADGMAVPLTDRVAAAEALGQAGDPRLEKPIWVETEPGLWFAQFPVTVQDYARFVDAGGYDQEGFGRDWIEEWQAGVEQMLQLEPYRDWQWLKDDRKRREPGDWLQQLATSSRPVVGISWYEAAAFCRWCTARETGSWQYRLPLLREWQYAAAGLQGVGPYPWGDADPGSGDNARANYEKAGVKRPTPVGLFPTGAASWGEAGELHDMAGNVWEWCDDPLSNQGEPAVGGLFRPLCGGCYWDVSEDLVVSFWLRSRAALWYGHFGFRVVRCARRPPALGT